MCMIDDCDERVTMVSSGDVTARREHKCDECYRVIRHGERYRRDAFVSEGEFHHHKTCGHCMVARQWLSDECGGWMYGGVEEDVRDHCTGYGEYPFGVHRLAVGMRNRWTRRNGALMPIPVLPPTTHERMAALGQEGGRNG